MTPKEALETIKYLEANDMGRCVIDYCQKECDVVDKALTELEELKCDVKRFIDLYHAFEEHGLCGDEADEFLKLEVKLMKVGAKDV